MIIVVIDHRFGSLMMCIALGSTSVSLMAAGRGSKYSRLG